MLFRSNEARKGVLLSATWLSSFRPSFMEVLAGHPVFASNCKRVGYERLLRSVGNFGAIGIEDHCEDNNAASDHLPDEIANRVFLTKTAKSQFVSKNTSVWRRGAPTAGCVK